MDFFFFWMLLFILFKGYCVIKFEVIFYFLWYIYGNKILLDMV